VDVDSLVRAVYFVCDGIPTDGAPDALFVDSRMQRGDIEVGIWDL
jgi:hypothetical protein